MTNSFKTDDNCLFCKIVKGEIPCEKVFETESVFAFKDIAPQAPTHILFIHKEHTQNLLEMAGDPNKVASVMAAIKEYVDSVGPQLSEFRVVTNCGASAGQTVFHTHFHLLSGQSLGSFGS